MSLQRGCKLNETEPGIARADLQSKRNGSLRKSHAGVSLKLQKFEFSKCLFLRALNRSDYVARFALWKQILDLLEKSAHFIFNDLV